MKHQDRCKSDIRGLQETCTGQQELLGRIDDLENRTKRNNLVFWGIEETMDKTFDNSCEALIKWLIASHMKMEEAESIEIERAHRSGRKDSSGKPRPIHVLFLRHQQKESILRQARRTLKDNPLKGRKVFITDDVSHKVRKERKELREQLTNIRNQPGVMFAFIPWSVPARIIYKTPEGFRTIHYGDQSFQPE